MKTLFQIVTLEGATEYTAEELAAAYPTATREMDDAQRRVIRPELHDQPKIEGLCGPMWGGWRDAEGVSVFLEDDRDPTSAPKSYSHSKGPVTTVVIRYESWEAYEAYSS